MYFLFLICKYYDIIILYFIFHLQLLMEALIINLTDLFKSGTFFALTYMLYMVKQLNWAWAEWTFSSLQMYLFRAGTRLTVNITVPVFFFFFKLHMHTIHRYLMGPYAPNADSSNKQQNRQTVISLKRQIYVTGKAQDWM